MGALFLEKCGVVSILNYLFKVENGTINFNLDVNEVYTITTVKTGVKGSRGKPPSGGPFPLSYSDNFESK